MGFATSRSSCVPSPVRRGATEPHCADLRAYRLRLSSQLRRRPRVCFQKLCDLPTDRAEDPRNGETDQERGREQSDDAGHDPDHHP